MNKQDYDKLANEPGSTCQGLTLDQVRKLRDYIYYSVKYLKLPIDTGKKDELSLFGLMRNFSTAHAFLSFERINGERIEPEDVEGAYRADENGKKLSGSEFHGYYACAIQNIAELVADELGLLDAFNKLYN